MGRESTEDAGQPVAMVTGGAVRIGAAIAEALARSGYEVVVHCNRSRAEADKLAEAIESAGGRAHVVQAELLDARAGGNLVRSVCDAVGRLDVLVNNAAVFHQDSLFDATGAAFEREIRINYEAPRRLTEAFAERGCPGVVINLLDRRVSGFDPTCLPYLVSKHMLAAFTRAAALRYAPLLRVNGVAPGAVLAPPGKDDTYLREGGRDNPLRCRCTPEDVARAVLFLVTRGDMTGQVLYVDGGRGLAEEPAPNG